MGLVKWLRDRRATRLPKREWDFPEVSTFERANDVLVYLICFSYDAPTTCMGTWLREILSGRGIDQSTVFRFADDKTTKQELLKALSSEKERVEIFCGHGSITGLYGPPQQEVAGSILADLSSIIYDSEMITPTPSSMFAFCCQAAQTFGRIFSSYKDKQFMGFRDDVPFPLELYDDLKYVFQSVAKDIIQRGQIVEGHKEMFLEKLDEVARQPIDFQNATLIALWLDEYRKHLMIYA